MQERLQKILARAGLASRRAAEKLVLEGRVTVNGETVRELGSKADPERDDVRLDGTRVRAPERLVYIALYKPKGVICTRRDPEGRPTVMDLVPRVPGLFPVGRLDTTTEGLLLLTNDGAFAERASHPRYEVPRVYHAKVYRIPDATTLERLVRGVSVEGQRMSADRVRVLDADSNSWLEVTLHEGKHHEVRRLLEAVGHPVSKLRRVSFGPVSLKGLAVGQCRALSADEVRALKHGRAVEARPQRLARVARGGHRPGRRPQPPTPDASTSAVPPPPVRPAGPRLPATRPAAARPAPRPGSARPPAPRPASLRPGASRPARSGAASRPPARRRRP